MADEKLKMTESETAEKIKSETSGFGVRHFQILMMTICATVVYVTRSSMGAAILAMTDTSRNSVNNTNIEIYSWSDEIRGVILSSFFWGYTIMQIPSGILCKHFGGKPLLLTALIVSGVMAAATPALARIGGWVAVCVVRACMGLTQSSFMPGMHTLLGQWAPPQERTRMGILAYAGIQMGTIMTMPICGYMAKSSMGWSLIFYSMGALSLGTAAVFWVLTASSPRQHRFISTTELLYIEQSLSSKTEEEVPIPWCKIFTSVPLVAITLAHVGVNWSFVLFLVQIPAYLNNALGINLTDSATISALPFMAQWFFAILSSFVSDYLINNKIITVTTSRKLFNSIGAVGTSACLVVMSFITSEHKVVAVIVLTLACGSIGSATCGYMMNHIDLSPRFAGVLFGITNCIANLVGILAPLSTGFILGDDSSDIGRWRIVFFTAATLLVLTNVLYCTFGSCDLQRWNEPQSDTYDLGYPNKDSLESSPQNKEDGKTYNFLIKESN